MGIAEAMSEREQWVEILLVEPLVSDRGAFAVIHVEGGLGLAVIVGEDGMGQLIQRCREGRGQAARGIDLAEQDAGNGFAAARAGIPGFQHDRRLGQPRHQDRTAGFQHHHGLGIGGGDGVDQGVLVVG